MTLRTGAVGRVGHCRQNLSFLVVGRWDAAAAVVPSGFVAQLVGVFSSLYPRRPSGQTVVTGPSSSSFCCVATTVSNSDTAAVPGTHETGVTTIGVEQYACNVRPLSPLSGWCHTNQYSKTERRENT